MLVARGHRRDHPADRPRTLPLLRARDAQPGNGNARTTGVYRFDLTTGDSVGASRSLGSPARTRPPASSTGSRCRPTWSFRRTGSTTPARSSAVGPAAASAAADTSDPNRRRARRRAPAGLRLAVERYSDGRSVQVPSAAPSRSTASDVRAARGLCPGPPTQGGPATPAIGRH